MKQNTNLLFILKIVAVVLLALLGMWLLLDGLYYTSSLPFLALIAVAISIYYDRRNLILRMERMVSSIRSLDFSNHFPISSSKDELGQLSKEMNEAIEVYRSLLQNSMADEAETQAWQKLISVLTHEIMNSIAPIISLSETLSDAEVSPETDTQEYRIMRQAMETIHRRSKGLLAFVENYRKLSRLPQPTLQPVDLQSFFHSLQQLNAACNINFTYSVYPEHLHLNADREMLEQMFINLLKNAKEACDGRPNTIIDIKAQKVGKEVQIVVSDNGIGISPEAIDKVFIPFFSTKNGGSGIGLSICRQIMILHKGRISVKSDENGSRFILIF